MQQYPRYAGGAVHEQASPGERLLDVTVTLLEIGRDVLGLAVQQRVGDVLYAGVDLKVREAFGCGDYGSDVVLGLQLLVDSGIEVTEK
ncbi:unnamed protein product [Sphagnum balticum]